MIPVFLGIFVCPVVAEKPDGRSQETPQEGVLVLHGGQVMQGKIVRSGDLYRVILSGGEIRIRATEVAYQSESLEAAYRHRREMINLGNADEHINLARWCLRNGLLSATARELADAMAANPNHPWIPHLERRLKAALSPPVAPTASTLAQRPKAPSGEELDQMVRRMPSGSVEAFTATIQPLLINSCTSGGCHGPQSGDRFHLLRSRAGHGPSRRMTQRNLHAALEFIDREHPENSPLLTEAIRAHGKAEVAALGKKGSPKYYQIAQWIYLVASSDRQGRPLPKEVDSAKPLIQQAEPGKKPAVMAAAWPEQTLQAASFKPDGVTPASHQAPLGTQNVSPTKFDRPDVQRGAKIERFVPADPFDPEIFNRRYHGKSGS